jgi:hypothetical protein
MNLIKSFLCLVLIFTTGSATSAQETRPPRTPRKAPVAPIAQPSTVSFDTLLAKETYKVYAEVRNVGQVIRSGSVNELLEPVMKLAAPSQELQSLVKWLNVHAEELMTSRLMVATWSTAPGVPAMIAVLEFDSPDEARKFTPQLNSFLPKVLPAPTPTSNPDEGQHKRFEADLQSVKNGQYAFIYVFSRKDGEAFSADDSAFLRANTAEIHDWVNSGNNHKVIGGTNVELTGPKLELLRSRFQVEDYNSRSDINSKPQPTDSANLPGYQLQQVNSLILITPTPVTLKNLRPSGSKLLTDDPSFRVARGRFVSEQVFIYFDISEVLNEETKNRELEAQELEQTEGLKPNPVPPEEQPTLIAEKAEANSAPVIAPSPEVEATPMATPDPFETALSEAANSFFVGQAKWPDAFGFGISFENDSLDVKALMVSKPGEKSDLIPIFPNLIPAAALTPESPSILPADTELFAMLSLDLPQIYAAITKRPVAVKPEPVAAKPPSLPFAEIENRLKISIKDELLPLLGSEIVISMPVKMLEGGPLPASSSTPSPSPGSQDSQTAPSEPSFVVAISLRDKEGMKVLLPKIVDSVGFKGASAFARKESREDTEIISYGNMLSYAFVANFLVVSADTNAIRHVVDSYLKHETLSSDTQFKNYTRWQPQQLQAQVYVSPALMKTYNSWVDQPSAIMSDQLRDFLSRVTLMAQPITYSLSSDGLGTLHELHIPKNLVLMAVAGVSAESNPSPLVANERGAISALYAIASAENQYRTGKGSGSFGTLEQLQAEGLITEKTAEPTGYKVNLSLVGARFELTATPLEHGKTGKFSYFMDETNILRGADHSGGMATSTDPPMD